MIAEREGGPAFPFVYDDNETPGVTKRNVHIGMTLRDYFAGQALAGLPDVYPPDQLAKMAYGRADAMLKEREK